MEVKPYLDKANDRLKTAKCRLRIHIKGGSLTLRGTLPPKPESDRDKPYQQWIYTGLPANPSGVAQAERLAKKISSQLDCKEFTWLEWRNTPPEEEKSKPTIANFHQDYLARGGNPRTWHRDYWLILKRIEGEATPETLKAIVLETKPNSCMRKKACMVINAYCKFAGIDLDIRRYRGSYSPFTSPQKRNIPTDQTILENWEKMHPDWRWVYGVLACYGLRNHEAFRLDLSDFPIIKVGEDSKTGWRETWPCPLEWVERWNLKDMALPNVRLEQHNQELGDRVTQAFNRSKIPFNPYDLRHAWAIRTLQESWPVELSASLMGHSVDVHTKTYQRWITRERKMSIFDHLVRGLN